MIGAPKKFLFLGEKEEHSGGWNGLRRLCEGARVSRKDVPTWAEEDLNLHGP